MILRRTRWLACISVLLMGSWSASAADLDLYRDFRLGASATDIVSVAGLAARDLKTVHERPSLIQELSWRPPYVSGRPAGGRDSVRAIVFSFVDNRLFKMAVEYERSRTEGMSRDDMIASLTSVYGAPTPLAVQPARRGGYDGLETPLTIAQWRDDETQLTLQQSTYGSTFTLVVTSIALEQRARQAQTAAVALDVKEAPAREAARVKEQADAAKNAAEKTRTTNKATFEP